MGAVAMNPDVRGRNRLACIAALACGVLLSLGSSEASAAIFYCNRQVPPQYECGPLNVYAQVANTNQAYVPQTPGYPLCERATVRYHAANVSFRCGGGPVDSGCDMRYSNLSASPLSMYVINNAPSGWLTAYLVGKAYEGNPCV